MGQRIEYCRHNGDCGVTDLLRESEFDVDVRFCLDRCGECYRTPFLVADGELVSGGTHERVLETVRDDAEGDE